MRLNLGCGSNLRPGWLNIDIKPGSESETYISHDLSKGLPPALFFLIGQVETVYSSHFLEHLTLDQSRKLLSDCYTVLNHGGEIRLCLPDFKAAVKAYLDNDTEYFNLLAHSHLAPLGKEYEPIDCIADLVYQYMNGINEHKDIWDYEKAIRELTKVGFKAKIVEFDPALDIDLELRKRYSFYVQGTK
jgi:predicted SAM-dependent methyltransferase